MKCSDIPDSVFLFAVEYARTARGFSTATRWDVAAVLAGCPDHVGSAHEDYVLMPHKLVLAKARKLIRRGLLEGCACGCRGNFAPVELKGGWVSSRVTWTETRQG